MKYLIDYNNEYDYDDYYHIVTGLHINLLLPVRQLSCILPSQIYCILLSYFPEILNVFNVFQKHIYLIMARS